MRVLRLVAVNESGSHLLLRAEGDGIEFVLPLDARLRAAVNGDKERLGQLEVQLDSQLRPREIQARIRGGESVESVAQVANVPLDRVMRYASPVLAERSHIADLARRSALRRPGGQGSTPALDDVVVGELERQGVAENDVLWDAYRRDDGRWIVRASWRLDSTDRTAEWTFDPSGRSVAPANDEARWVVGERPPAPPASPVGAARLTVVSDSTTSTASRTREEQPAQDIAELDWTVADEASETDDPDEVPTVEVPSPVLTHPGDEDTRLRLSDIASHIEVEDAEDSGRDDPPQPRHPRVAATGSGRNRRPSVPSWDEIMFGSRQRGD